MTNIRTTQHAGQLWIDTASIARTLNRKTADLRADLKGLDIQPEDTRTTTEGGLTRWYSLATAERIVRRLADNGEADDFLALLPDLEIALPPQQTGIITGRLEKFRTNMEGYARQIDDLAARTEAAMEERLGLQEALAAYAEAQTQQLKEFMARLK